MALEEDTIIVADITPDQVLQDLCAADENDVVFTECPNETFNQKGDQKVDFSRCLRYFHAQNHLQVCKDCNQLTTTASTIQDIIADLTKEMSTKQ